MSLCQLRPPALQQHIGGTPSEKLAIVPDIQGYSLEGDTRGCKRYRNNDSDCLSFGEEELDLLGSLQDTKRHCGYDLTPSPDPVQLVENIRTEVFTADLEVKGTYDFGAGAEASIFTCGGNSPSSVSSSPGVDFAAPSSGGGAQTSAGCQQILDFQDFFPDMQRQQQQVVLSLPSTHADKYELVITEQPEEVGNLQMALQCTLSAVSLKKLMSL